VELDTGAGVSVLPEKVIEEKLCKYELRPACVKLKAYGGAVIEPIGVIGNTN